MIPVIEILEAIGLIMGAATIIARLTPNQDDDKIVEKIRKIIESIGNLFIPNVGKN